jgi:hypothetical protein
MAIKKMELAAYTNIRQIVFNGSPAEQKLASWVAQHVDGLLTGNGYEVDPKFYSVNPLTITYSKSGVDQAEAEAIFAALEGALKVKTMVGTQNSASPFVRLFNRWLANGVSTYCVVTFWRNGVVAVKFTT